MAILPFGYSSNAVHSALDQMIVGGPMIEAFVRKFSHDPIDVTVLTALPALLDTGGGVNVIEKSVVASMGLTPIDRLPIFGVSGQVTVEFYRLQLIVPQLNYARIGKFAALDLQSQQRPYAVILGRPFLSRFRLAIDGRAGVGQLDG